MFALARAILTTIFLSFCLPVALFHTNAVAAEQEKEQVSEKAATENNLAKAASKTPSTTAENSADKDKSTDNKPATEEKASSTQQTRIINAPTDAFKQQQQDIKHYLKGDGIEAMLVGTDEFITLTDQHNTAINKGVMILIPDWQQSAASPNAINQLRNNMPDQGWTILTLHPPHQPNNYPSKALTAEDRLKENNESLTSYQKKLSEVIATVINKAKNYPGAILIIAEGQHAALIVNMIDSELIEAPGALVMLSSYMPTKAENMKLAEQVAVTEYPILDLYLKRDHRLVLANTDNRKHRVKNEMKVYYRQKQLSNQATSYYPKSSLTREILGWLKAIGW